MPLGSVPAGGERPATVADVARMAEVSAMTVSRVINAQAKVADSTRDRVQAAMKALDYRPNLMARGLSSGRSHTIGVLTESTTLWGPSAAVHGIELAANRRGYAVTMTHLTESGPDAVVRGANLLRSRSCDGLVLVQPRITSNAVTLPAALPPLVAIHGGDIGDYPLIGIDQFAGAEQATQHLLDLGHSTVHHLAGPADWYESAERERGWRSALEAAGRRAPAVVRGDWSARTGYRATTALLDADGVTALFCANDEMALGALYAIRERGRDCPTDISLVGFDDIASAEFSWPPLTTIRQDFDEIGRLAVGLLLDMIESGSKSAAPISLDPTLVVRQSTAAP